MIQPFSLAVTSLVWKWVAPRLFWSSMASARCRHSLALRFAFLVPLRLAAFLSLAQLGTGCSSAPGTL